MREESAACRPRRVGQNVLPATTPRRETTEVRRLGDTGRVARHISRGLLLLALVTSRLAAQGVPAFRDSATVVPGPQFSTTSWIRWLATPLFGSRYRQLWRTPITLPVLDVRATGGGLRASGTADGEVSGVLDLEAADGSRWAFWPLDRTDQRPMPTMIPSNVSEGLIADLTSGRNPAGPLVANELAEAASVPNAYGWLVVWPKDAALGSPDTAYAGRAGYLVRRDPLARRDSLGPISPGTVVTALAMLHRVLGGAAETVDARTTLRALLFNVFIGNLDPNFLQWRWEAVAMPGGIVWRPLGIFRESALAKYDGTVTYLSRPVMPDLANFGPKYPHILTGIPDQASAYRFLLGSLGRPVWDSTASALQQALTDSAIAAAVSRMPAPYLAAIGPELIETLRKRRDNLPRAVEHMFSSVRSEAELHGTRASESVVADWLTTDSLSLGTGEAPVKFSGRETDRVTLFLSGGADTLTIAGTRGKRPALRIVPGKGTPLHVVDSTRTGAVSVSGKDLTLTQDPPDAIRVQSATVPDPLAHLDSTGAVRTDGHRAFSPTVVFAITSGVGVLIGGGVVRTDWSGETRPFRNRSSLRAAYGSESKSGVVDLETDFRWSHSPLQLHVNAIASGVGAIYFYGFGNETPSTNSSSYYRAGRSVYALTPYVLLPLSKRVRVTTGLDVRQVYTPLDTTLFIGADRPYGSPNFGEGGFTGSVTLDTRDVRGAPRHGAYALLSGAWYPFIRDGSGSFGKVSVSAASYVTPSWWKAMTVASRISGTATWGTVPYFESAFIGGGRTVRGLSQGRYEGNQAVFGNLDLRLRVSQVQFVLPWDFGVLGLADLGRVFVPGETSDVWHPSFGGGLWAALLDRTLAASLNVATGAGQGVFINAGGGFTF